MTVRAANAECELRAAVSSQFDFASVARSSLLASPTLSRHTSNERNVRRPLGETAHQYGYHCVPNGT